MAQDHLQSNFTEQQYANLCCMPVYYHAAINQREATEGDMYLPRVDQQALPLQRSLGAEDFLPYQRRNGAVHCAAARLQRMLAGSDRSTLQYPCISLHAD